MPEPSPRWWMRLQWRSHKVIWDLSGGRLGARIGGMPVLELTTVGHRSGEKRRILISYLETDGGPVLAGSNAGAERDPAWIENLRANPGAEIMRAGSTRPVRANFLDGDEYDRLWSVFKEADEAYADYQEMTRRRISLVRLEPVEG